MIVSKFNIFIKILIASFLNNSCVCQERSSDETENEREESISSAQDRGVMLHIDISYEFHNRHQN